MTAEDTKLHAEIALAIKAAKKKLFKRHREGMDYGEAVDRFIDELTQRLTIIMPDHSPQRNGGAQ